MITSEGLTKENFFNEMNEIFPNAMRLFGKWIDEYKKKVEWDQLFQNKALRNPQQSITYPTAIKFHNIPYDMQVGIWIAFADTTLNELFEQPEYVYCGDLREDIKEVFNEINDLEELSC